MAADLEADLREAEAEGASPKDVLGSGAADPRSFAASWAAERAVIPRPTLTARLRRRSLIHAALAALTLVAALGAALVIFASPDASAPTAAIRLPAPASYPTTIWTGKDGLARAALARQEADLANEHASFLSQLPEGAVWVQANSGIVLRLPQAHGPGVEIHTVGSILLIVGIVGVILSMLFLFWSSRAGADHSSRRQTA
jgi:hypothetical protein